MTPRRPQLPHRRASAFGFLFWMRLACLGLCLAVPAATMAQPGSQEQNAQDTYLWDGQIDSVDGPVMTITTRVVSREGFAGAQGLRRGEPIVITWSGVDGRASGIRLLTPHGPPVDRFGLAARFVSVDQDTGYVTFKVGTSVRGLATARSLEAGAWTTVTSSHRPSERGLVGIGRYSENGADQRSAEAADTFEWHGELVAVDDDGVTLRARVVSPEGLTAMGALLRDEPIVVTWSGSGDRAHGIRFVRPDISPETGRRFQLQAEFVAADPATRHVTFRVITQDGTLAAVQDLDRGAWVTATSLHRPADAASSVVRVDPFVVSSRREMTRVAPPARSTYQWSGQIAGVGADTVTIRSRVASRAVLASMQGWRRGEPIVITWSGSGELASGIRLITRGHPSQVARFQLRARFITADPDTQYVNFSLDRRDGSLAAAPSLTPGTWVTVTTRHQPNAEAVVVVDAFDRSRHARRYTWLGDLVSVDTDRRTVVVSVAAEDHIFRYIDRFAAGEEVVIVWAATGGDEVAAIRSVAAREDAAVRYGYILPARFTGADQARQRLTFSMRVPESTVASWAALRPGAPVRVTSLFEQGQTDTAAILTVE